MTRRRGNGAGDPDASGAPDCRVLSGRRIEELTLEAALRGDLSPVDRLDAADAPLCAALVREAAAVYGRRGILAPG